MYVKLYNLKMGLNLDERYKDVDNSVECKLAIYNKLCRCGERLRRKEIQNPYLISFQRSHDWLSIEFQL